MPKTHLIFILSVVTILSACSKDPETSQSSLTDIKTWMYQIQDLDDEDKLAALAKTEYPLLVIEPGFNFTDFPYDTQAIINQPS